MKRQKRRTSGKQGTKPVEAMMKAARAAHGGMGVRRPDTMPSRMTVSKQRQEVTPLEKRPKRVQREVLGMWPDLDFDAYNKQRAAWEKGEAERRAKMRAAFEAQATRRRIGGYMKDRGQA